jgi:hypothetical protein
MRDIGLLVWVVLLIVGVVGSMSSRIRSQRRMQGSQAPARQRPRPQPAVSMWPPPQVTGPAQSTVLQATRPAASQPLQATPPAPSPQPRAAPAVKPRPDSQKPVAAVPSETRKAPRPLFAGRREIVRAVIAAEVLGKPRALSDEYWGA